MDNLNPMKCPLISAALKAWPDSFPSIDPLVRPRPSQQQKKEVSVNSGHRNQTANANYLEYLHLVFWLEIVQINFVLVQIEVGFQHGFPLVLVDRIRLGRRRGGHRHRNQRSNLTLDVSQGSPNHLHFMSFTQLCSTSLAELGAHQNKIFLIFIFLFYFHFRNRNRKGSACLFLLSFPPLRGEQTAAIQQSKRRPPPFVYHSLHRNIYFTL